MSVPKTIKLNNGVELPTVGLGTYGAGEVENAVKTAIDVGYRHFDCAWFYGNEAEIGTAIREKIANGDVKREELFITSKLWNNFHAKDAVVPKLKESLKALGLDYLDLYLVHWPVGFKEDTPSQPLQIDKSIYSDVDYLETWQGMEEAQRLGLTKAIGISNFNSEQIDRLLKHATIKPVVNQVECNPNFNQSKLIRFCKERDIAIVGYCPLGSSEKSSTQGKPDSTLFDPKVAAIGKKHNKSPAQVILNYLVVNQGISVIPKSATASRIKENIEIYDFVLAPDEVAYLDASNKNKRVCPATEIQDHKYYSFHAEF